METLAWIIDEWDWSGTIRQASYKVELIVEDGRARQITVRKDGRAVEPEKARELLGKLVTDFATANEVKLLGLVL